jgi:PEP-CTERM motif
MMRRITPSLAALGLVILGSGAEASVVIDIAQDGPNVVASGSGAIDLADLSYLGSGNLQMPSTVWGSKGAVIFVGSSRESHEYGLSSGPTSFGTGSFPYYTTTHSGDSFGLSSAGQDLIVTAGYVSGSPLSGSATFDSATIASLGLTPGRYVYTWGNGANADSLTVNIGGVPEPATWGMMITGLGLLGAFYRRRAITPRFAS